jgi:hypothetical protein
MIGHGEADKTATAQAVRDAVQETGFTPEPQGLAALADRMLDAKDEAEDDDSPPSADELARIDANPTLKSTYRSLVRRGKEAIGRLTHQEQEAERALQGIEALRGDPEGAVRAMARAAGMRIADEPTLEDRVRADLAKSIGQEAADMLGPAIVQSVKAITGSMVAPFAQEHEQRAMAESHAHLKGEVAGFAKRVQDEGGEFDPEIEAEMAALVPRLPPGQGVTVPEYLDILYSQVVAKRGRGRRAPRRGEDTDIHVKLSAKEATRRAVAAARRDLE